MGKKLAYKKFTLGNSITKDELDFFNQYGFVHYKGFISRERATKAAQGIDSVQREIIAKEITKINGIPIKFGVDEHGEKIIQRFPYTNCKVKEVAEFYTDPRLQNLGAFLPDSPYPKRIGLKEKDGVVANHYVNTPDSKYKQLGWHTDVAREFALGIKMYPMLNVGIYLMDSNNENGGLRTLPGTHTDKSFKVLFRKMQVLNTKDDPNEIEMEAEAGDLCLHDGRLWHRVAKSPHMGEKSHRRVMYVAFLSGPKDERSEKSKTPFYHKFLGLAK
jgi:hypothetical protein